MSERQQPFNDHSYESIFIDFIEGSRSKDLGISLFEQKMQEAQDTLVSSAMEAKGVSHERMQEIEDALNEEWRFHDDIAEVSGRIYLAESDIAGLAPESWGTPDIDERGRQYYFIENTRLRSHGIEAIPEVHGEGENLSVDLRLGYVFSAEEDDSARPVFTAYLGELARHEYPTPTPAEASLRLERQWPEHFALLQRLVRPDAQAAMPLRLSHIARRLQKEIANSDEFREYVVLYINESLSFDDKLPYVVEYTGSLNCYDGNSPFDPDDGGQWMNVKLDAPFSSLLYGPGMHFTKHEDGVYRAHIIGSTYNKDDGDDAEFVTTNVENITSMRSTRSVGSIISRAMQNENASMMINGEELETVVKKAASVASEPVYSTETSVLPSEDESNEPAYLRKMKGLEQAFRNAIKEVKRESRYQYATHAEAEAASRHVVSKYLEAQLLEAGISYNYELIFSGQGAMRPKTDPELPDTSGRPSVFTFGVDPDQPYVRLQDGDSFKAYAASIQPFVREVKDESDETAGYRVMPSLVAQFARDMHPALTWDGVNVVDITVDRRAVIPLDGTVDIAISALEDHRSMVSVMSAVKKAYGGEGKAAYIEKLQRALQRESKEFTILKHVEYLSELDGFAKELRVQGLNATPLMNTLEYLFVGKTLGVKGEAFINRANGLEPFEVDENEGVIGGNVIDVRNDLLSDDITLAIRTGSQEVLHVPIRSVKHLNF